MVDLFTECLSPESQVRYVISISRMGVNLPSLRKTVGK